MQSIIPQDWRPAAVIVMCISFMIIGWGLCRFSDVLRDWYQDWRECRAEARAGLAEGEIQYGDFSQEPLDVEYGIPLGPLPYLPSAADNGRDPDEPLTAELAPARLRPDEPEAALPPGPNIAGDTREGVVVPMPRGLREDNADWPQPAEWSMAVFIPDPDALPPLSAEAMANPDDTMTDLPVVPVTPPSPGTERTAEILARAEELLGLPVPVDWNRMLENASA